ncbi:hypothetical protein [Pseudotabrizicola sp. L79]|uniref:hypothetical protein n=1 Tax=Pseudotabrizicola sp. L79 TaxID=3118402 RepID=UPI002F94C65C
MNTRSRPPRKAVGADLIIPVVATAYAIYYIGSVWDFPPEAQRSGLFMASMLMFFTSILFVRTAIQLARGTAYISFAAVLGPEEGRLQRLAFFGLIVGYLLIVQWGGFTLTTFLFLLGGSYLAGLRPLGKALIFAAVAAISGWLFFIVLLKTRFPLGPFEQLIAFIGASWN